MKYEAEKAFHAQLRKPFIVLPANATNKQKQAALRLAGKHNLKEKP